MAVDQDIETEILRFHFVEKWGPHTIAKQLGVHHSVVERVLSQSGMPRPTRTKTATMIDPFVPFILETMNKYPKLSAARLFVMAQERGYPGGPSMFRQRISELRPKPTPEAYLRLRTLPGEQAQVDWGHFGHLEIGRAKRPLMAFVMVLSYSRQIFLRFYLNSRMESFIRGHVDAFESWQGVPKVLLYDNLKSAVLERRGDAIRFHPTLLELAAHYRFDPRPVAVARGNEKGRVERAIRYIRGNFMAGRQWQDLTDLNDQARQWCVHHSANRPWPEDPGITVAEAYSKEQLIKLPDSAFEAQDLVAVSVGKTPYIRFDLNDYSIPHIHTHKTLTVLATETLVRVIEDDQVLAEHARSYDKGQQIENPEHIKALVERKKAAKQSRGQDRLIHAAGSSQAFLEMLDKQQYHLGQAVKALLKLLDSYGANELEAALKATLEQGTVHVNAVCQILEVRREQRQQPPPLSVPVNDKAKDIVVSPASLDAYKQLTENTDD